MNPDRQEAGEKVSWTSGIVFGKGEVCLSSLAVCQYVSTWREYCSMLGRIEKRNKGSEGTGNWMENNRVACLVRRKEKGKENKVENRSFAVPAI